MTKRTRLLPVSVALVGALTLTGCGGSDETTDGTAAGASPTPAETSAATEDGSAAPDDTAQSDAVFGAAIQTAEAAVPGGRAVDYEVDDDDAKIDIEVVADGVVHDLEVSADGTQVLTQERDDTLDGDDLAEVRAVSVPITDAVATALAESPGTVVDVELEAEHGVVRWQIDVRGGAATTRLHVDAASGELIG